jgi:hypothetical protein
MVECKVCGKGNDELAVTCTACGGFLQAKVEALDLFATMWGLFERPRATMRRIVLARRKNYVFFLSAIAGVFFAFAGLWAVSAGERFETIFSLMGTGLLAGPPLGIVSALGFTGLLAICVRLAGGRGRYRDLLAVASYSASPVAVTVVVALPLTFALFGLYYFGSNPPPQVLDPAAFYVLTVLYVLALLWSWVLLVTGTAIAGRLSTVRAFVASLVVPALFAGALGAGFMLRSTPAWE